MTEDEKDYGSFNPTAKRNQPGICGKCPYLNIKDFDIRINKKTNLSERLYRCKLPGRNNHVIGYINFNYELNGMGCSGHLAYKYKEPKQLSLF